MIKEELLFSLEVGKLVASIATPIAVIIIGVLVLRRVESIKAEFAQQSEFKRKWAEQFFGCCQEFLNSFDRELAVLSILTHSKDPNDTVRKKLQTEISDLHPRLIELELRIRRSVIFAPRTGFAVTQAAKACITLTGSMIAARRGNFDEIIGKMNDFNEAVRKAHAEMLGIQER